MSDFSLVGNDVGIAVCYYYYFAGLYVDRTRANIRYVKGFMGSTLIIKSIITDIGAISGPS